MAGRKLYAVSIYPNRTVRLKARPTWWQLFEYAFKNEAVLMKPNRALGIWYNEPCHRFELDIVVYTHDLAEAIALGRRHRQTCIFNLLIGEEIHLGLPARTSRPPRTGSRNA